MAPDVGVEGKKHGDDEEKQTPYSYDDLFNPPLGNRMGYRCRDIREGGYEKRWKSMRVNPLAGIDDDKSRAK